MAPIRIFCGVDAGGTTFKCGAADRYGRILARLRIDTGADPAATVAASAAFFRTAAHQHGGMIAGVGLASFGPLDLDPASPKFGGLLQTPKPGWSMFALRDAFAEALGAPVAIDTDVNAALLAELRWGAARGVDTAAYFTIGTGIGAAIYARGGLLGRPTHPEFGHIAVRRAPGDATFVSACPFHDDCLEGLASGAALSARFGDIAALADDHPCWSLAGDYLAQACRAVFLAVRPQRIVFGGGVMRRQILRERIQRNWAASMGGYLDFGIDAARRIAVGAGLGDDAGLMGALLLASSADAGSTGS